MLKVIITADDFGASHGTNMAVKNAFTNGILSRASLFTNSYWTNDAIRNAKKYRIPTGLHFNLTTGRPLNHMLAGKDGFFQLSFLKLLLMQFGWNNHLIKEVEKELNLQIKVFKKNKLKIVHFDSEKHIHMIPWLFKILVQKAREEKVKIRFTYEPIRITWRINGLLKAILINLFSLINKKYITNNIKSANIFFGLIDSNHMNAMTMIRSIKYAIKNKYKTIEIGLHPALIKQKSDIYMNTFFERYSNLVNREIEYYGLLNKELFIFLKNKDLMLVKK